MSRDNSKCSVCTSETRVIGFHRLDRALTLRALSSDVLEGSFDLGLVLILELVLVAHHQVGVKDPQLWGWKRRGIH